MVQPSASDRPSHLVEDQAEVFAFLADPRSHCGQPVERLDTHGAVVFLAGAEAWKVKRAVLFPFMDYSTLEKRRLACVAEVAVNSPNAPGIYLGVVPVVRVAAGLALGGEGTPVEWAVHMRRFAEDEVLDRVAARGGLTPELLVGLARAVVAAHRRAAIRDGGRAVECLARFVGQNAAALRESPALFPAAEADDLTRRSREALAALRDLLLDRGKAGHVRQCHGDLHLRNIVLWKGEPTLFDAIEFDPDIATCDVLYDLAFLLMDMWEKGHRQAANALMNRYCWETGEEHLAGLRALPFFLSLRAAIRAKVVAAGLAHLDGERAARAAADARAYFRLAGECLAAPAPRLVAVAGRSGTGKSVLAAALAPRLGGPPGAVHLRSDVLRKRLFRVGEFDRLPQEAYSAEAGREVYAALARQAGLALEAGRSVVVDAVCAQAWQRELLEGAAGRAGVPFQGLWLEAPLPVLLARVAARALDASDAGPAVVRTQAEAPVPQGWAGVDASGSPQETLAAAARQLGLS